MRGGYRAPKYSTVLRRAKTKVHKAWVALETAKTLLQPYQRNILDRNDIAVIQLRVLLIESNLSGADDETK